MASRFKSGTGSWVATDRRKPTMSRTTDDTTDESVNQIMAREAFNLQNIRDEMEDVHGEPAHENEWLVIFSDSDGHEYNEIAAYTDGVSRDDVSEWMHRVARQVHDQSRLGGDPWSVADPVVIFKQSGMANKYAL